MTQVGDLLRVKADADGWHMRRVARHGWLYILTRRNGIFGDLLEAKSIATGAIVTLMEDSVEGAPDAEA